jgi:3-hydroxymyristoyl/3-hydroxydecanoyl-(acyl carrier protein) dehydratase
MRFQFVDRIDRIRKFTLARGVKTVSFEEGFLEGLQGEPGMLPRILMIECAAQLASWLVLYSTDFTKIPLVAKIDHASIDSSVPCGTALVLEAEIRSWSEEGAIVDCRASAGGREIASGLRCLCTFVESDMLVDPDEMRIRFMELAKGADIG